VAIQELPSENSVTTDELLFRLDQELNTTDLYNDGRKLRILKDLIEQQAKEAKKSFGRIKQHRVSTLAQ
jgi:hypothetical protein